MEETFGILSVLPPLLAIGLALWTRQVYLALAAGIWLGYLIIASGDPVAGTIGAIDAQVGVITDTGNARLVIFTLCMGALIALIQRSGGVEGFVNRILTYLSKAQTDQAGKGNRRIVETLAALTGLILFIESNISILTVGTVYRPVFDRLGIPREKLAYITDSTSAPSNILIPLNAWGAYIMVLLAAQDISNPFGTLMAAIVYNFYPLLTILLVFLTIWFGRDFGDMKKAEARARENGKLLRDGAVPMMDDSISMLDAKEGVTLRARNMLIPVASMVLLMPVFLAYTGWDGATGEGLARAWNAISTGKGSGSASVLYSVSSAILIAILLYKVQGLMGIREMTKLCLSGMSGMTGLLVLTIMAFSLNGMCRELGTGIYMANVASHFITPALVPALIFIVAGLIGFSTGTSWGTFAIMIAVAVPLAQTMDVNVTMAIAAALGGGVFGDHCSPTSDTTIITSMATANDHIDHVRTQLPYALIAGSGAVLLYLVMGFAGV